MLLGMMTLSGRIEGQALESGKVEGIFIYKRHAFLDDSSAVAMEYSSAINYPAVTYVLTAKGDRYRLDPAQVPYILPYPGRGEMTQEQALMVAALIIKRFPQYARLVENIRQGWMQMPPEKVAEATRASALRNNYMANSMETMYRTSQYQGAMNTNRTALDPNSPTIPAAPAPVAEDTGSGTDATVTTGTGGPSAAELQELEKTLQELKGSQ